MKVEGSFRPVDLARATGISAQTVRKYEGFGFLPPAHRNASGHRRYEQRHFEALLAARAMIGGYGWQPALAIMQRLHEGDLPGALAILDARHAEIHRRRRAVQETLTALLTVTAESAAASLPLTRIGRRPLRVGEAATLTGQRVSTLRRWEERGLLQPKRERSSGYRLYDAEQVRRLRIAALLRDAGYDFAAISRVLDELGADRPDRAITAAQERLQDLAESSTRCAAATAAFWQYISTFPPL